MQIHSTPPSEEAKRAFYESLLKQRLDYITTKQYRFDFRGLETNEFNK